MVLQTTRIKYPAQIVERPPYLKSVLQIGSDDKQPIAVKFAFKTHTLGGLIDFAITEPQRAGRYGVAPFTFAPCRLAD